MNYLQLLIKLLPFIISLVEAAEKIFVNAGSGAEKKAAVKDGLAALYNGTSALSTRDQAKTLGGLGPLVDVAIDTTANLLFPSRDEKEEN